MSDVTHLFPGAFLRRYGFPSCVPGRYRMYKTKGCKASRDGTRERPDHDTLRTREHLYMGVPLFGVGTPCAVVCERQTTRKSTMGCCPFGFHLKPFQNGYPQKGHPLTLCKGYLGPFAGACWSLACQRLPKGACERGKRAAG